MFRKFVDVLKEVFWIKPSPKKRKSARRKIVKKSPVKKKIIKKIPKPAAQPKLKPPAVKKTLKGAVKTIDPALMQVGEITHYFDRIKVCVVKLTEGSVLIGDKLTILGAKTKFVQKVWSMQIESNDVKVAKKGQLIGLKVDKIVTVGDKVYK
ncbi:MAG: hypothetical protein HQL12_05335 [Candidatus Omnitrophica bacterium]|nr:hypothetical protein [Candidatus Omnitrophota bacterium]